MPCPHKFSHDLTLQNIDFTPKTLIIGTFNPTWPLQNTAEWFYGRTRNNYFWDILPRLYGEKGLRQAPPSAWKAFCKRHQIALTDLITCLDDADEDNPDHQAWLADYTDSNLCRRFKNIKTTPILDILAAHPSITTIYLTRQEGLPFFDALWKPIVAYATTTSRSAHTLLTPSGNARFKMGAYKRQFPETKLSLVDFLVESWQKVGNFKG